MKDKRIMWEPYTCSIKAATFTISGTASEASVKASV